MLIYSNADVMDCIVKGEMYIYTLQFLPMPFYTVGHRHSHSIDNNAHLSLLPMCSLWLPFRIFFSPFSYF